MAPDGGGVALKLRAEDGDDLAVLSACLQDAIVPVRDLAYVRDRQMFVFIANRFRWESGLRPAPGDFRRQRILCAVTFEVVDAASYRGFSRRDEDRILALLAIRPEPAPGGGAAIHLEFSGHAAIRLEVARIQCRAKDLGEPWPTPWHPRHEPEGP
ncbi:MAG TPA: DUF2948 family protein [Stellaceae bacterium]|jgi:hypothetical protein|nr:DUF2948 family protein [Stellaceae bacterium]